MSNPQTNLPQTMPSRSSRIDSFISDEMRYRGHRIVWDTRPVLGTPFWTGKVAVVMPPDPENIEKVHSLGRSEYFLTEEDARDHLIEAAKNWIDCSVQTERSH